MFASENGLNGDPRLEAISQAIRVVPHFPKPGIMFQDITTLLLNPKAYKHTVDIFVDRYRDMDISVVAGIEARGFLFGPPIALAIGAKFVPLRKPKKLPGEVISECYELEYGTDCLQMHLGAVQPGERALIIDDLVATGGTLSAAIRLLERVGAEVVECACVIGLPEVKGKFELSGKPVYVLVEPRQFEDGCLRFVILNLLPLSLLSLGFIKVNSDAGLLGNRVVGLGMVARDEGGNVVAAGMKRIQEVGDVLRKRWLDFGASRKFSRKCFLRVIPTTSSMPLDQRPVNYAPVGLLLEDMLAISSNFSLFKLSHVKRTGNTVAHFIVRLPSLNGEE